MTRRLVVIGNGMAATRLVEELLIRGCRDAITVIGEEPGPGYNRILLSPLLAGEKSAEAIVLHHADWYAEHHIHLHTGDPATALDLHGKEVITASGAVFPWDRLVLATGSRAARLAIPGDSLDNVFSFRTLADTNRLADIASAGARALVVGGGLLGLEAAWGLHQRGASVTVIHNGDWLMNRQLDAEAGSLLAASLEARGIRVLTGARSECFVGDQTVSALKLTDGRRIDCDVAVICIGITPEIGLALHAGIPCERAIVTDRRLRTGIDSVYALGECCQIEGKLFGMVAPIWQQARILAACLCGEECESYQAEVLPTRLKVSGIDVFSAGDFSTAGDCRTLAWRDPVAGHYRRLWLRDGRLIAAVLFGDVGDGGRYFEMIQQSARIHDATALLLGMEQAA
ncbi:MAG: NAD(P)/FAD-dependent oxidoreductase [Alcanivoracaceae bacterium]